MRSRTSRGVPEWSGDEDLYMGSPYSVVGSVSKVDMIKHRTLPLPPRLVFALSIDMIGLCLSQYGYSFKENNGYSVYLNNTFNGLTPKMNGLLNLDRSDTHVHAKR